MQVEDTTKRNRSYYVLHKFEYSGQKFFSFYKQNINKTHYLHNIASELYSWGPPKLKSE